MPSGVYQRRLIPGEDRILGRIKKQPNDYWLWLGAIQPNGYGSLSIGERSKGEKRRVYAHRLAYETFIGPIPYGRELDHLCRNRACCNPAHLEPVPRSENTKRGIGPAILGAVNGNKARCKHGHPFDADNTRFRPAGGRACRACARNKQAEYRRQKHG